MSRHSDVTIVIPCFNHGRYLGEAVASARGQVGGEPRVVVVDDGSTDPDTVAAVDALRGQVEVLRQDNAGLAAARNAGAALTDTPFLLMLDSDDKLTPGALDALKAALRPKPELGFTYGRTRFFGDLTGELTLPPYSPYRLLYRSLVGATSLLRREAFEDVGGFDPGVGEYEDWDFYLGLLGRGWEGERVDEVTLLYRRHGASMFTEGRAVYRKRYRNLRRKHAALFAGSRELARRDGASVTDRIVYPTLWAWRPVPARVEQALYARLFR